MFEHQDIIDSDEPVFVISVAARMVGVRTQTLRYYERLGLISPARTPGNQRVFSRRDVARVQHIRRLMDDLGVNLAGVEVVLKLLVQVREAEARIERLEEDNEALRCRRPSRRSASG